MAQYDRLFEEQLKVDWHDPVSKNMGTRRYLMERMMVNRPFMYDKALVFSRAEVRACMSRLHACHGCMHVTVACM